MWVYSEIISIPHFCLQFLLSLPHASAAHMYMHGHGLSTGGNLLVCTSSRKNDCPFLRNHQPPTAFRPGVGLEVIYPICAGMLSGLILLRSCVLWVHMYNSYITSKRQCSLAHPPILYLHPFQQCSLSLGVGGVLHILGNHSATESHPTSLIS